VSRSVKRFASRTLVIQVKHNAGLRMWHFLTSSAWAN
jgi:hypothetical protein